MDERDHFNNDPRDYALMLVEHHVVNCRTLLTAALRAMSHDEVKRMLDDAELSPRFLYPEDK